MPSEGSSRSDLARAVVVGLVTGGIFAIIAFAALLGLVRVLQTRHLVGQQSVRASDGGPSQERAPWTETGLAMRALH